MSPSAGALLPTMRLSLPVYNQAGKGKIMRKGLHQDDACDAGTLDETL